MLWASLMFRENLPLVVLEYVFTMFVAAAVNPTQKIHKEIIHESFGASSASLAQGLWGNFAACGTESGPNSYFVRCFSWKFLN